MLHILKRIIITGCMDREIQSFTDFRGVGLCSKVLDIRIEGGFYLKDDWS
jgi:hypothetical protein